MLWLHCPPRTCGLFSVCLVTVSEQSLQQPSGKLGTERPFDFHTDVELHYVIRDTMHGSIYHDTILYMIPRITDTW